MVRKEYFNEGSAIGWQDVGGGKMRAKGKKLEEEVGDIGS
jgi:hypothetical protein